MAWSAGREIMKSHRSVVRFSPSSPEKRQKKGEYVMFKNLKKLTHLENTQKGTQRALRLLHAESSTEKSEVKLKY